MKIRNPKSEIRNLFALMVALCCSLLAAPCSLFSAQFIDERTIPPAITRDAEIIPTGVANALCITNTPGPTFNIAFCSTVDLTGKTVLYKIPEYTVATLPASHPLAIVTDATSASTCTAGGGSTKNVCWWNGSAWVSFGSGGGGVGDPGANGIAVRIALNTLIARQLDVVSGQITVTNPTGVAGNPTIGTGANVPLTNQANTFTANQIFNTAIVVPRKTTPGDLSLLANGEVFVDGELLKFKSNTGVLHTLFRITDPVVRVFERTAAPQLGDDTTQGYVVGDMWIATISGVRSIYQAASVATGAADWKCLTCGGSTPGLQVVSNVDRSISNAVDPATCFKVWNSDNGQGWCFYSDSAGVARLDTLQPSDWVLGIDSAKKFEFYDKVTFATGWRVNQGEVDVFDCPERASDPGSPPSTHRSIYCKSGNSAGFFTKDSAGSVNRVTQSQLIRKTADTQISSDATLNNDPHFSFSLAANETRTFEMVLSVASATDADFLIDFTGPTSITGTYHLQCLDTAATGFAGSMRLGTDPLEADSADSACGGAGAAGTGNDITMQIKGIAIGGGTAGTVQFRWSQFVSQATNTTIYANSYMIVTTH